MFRNEETHNLACPMCLPCNVLLYAMTREVDALILIVQMKKLRHRKIKHLGPGTHFVSGSI